MNILNNIIILPTELTYIIYDFLPINIRILLNKLNYILYREEYIYLKFNNGRDNPYVYKRKPMYKKYINRIIKYDLNYIMSFLYNENKNIWSSRYRVTDMGLNFIKHHKNELSYYKSLCKEYKSNKCMDILIYGNLLI